MMFHHLGGIAQRGRIDAMKTTIRNRAAALGVAAVAGLAGIGLASGPALAAPAPESATSAGAESESVRYPTDSGEYADAFVRAWGAGDMDRVASLSTPQVVDMLKEHGNENATHWVQTGGDGAAGTYWIDYKNTVTGETMNVPVANVEGPNGGENLGSSHAIHNVQFPD